MEKIKSPAYKNMSRQQLENSIELGRKILTGEADLVELDNRSLELRGKGPKASGKASGKMDVNPGKRKRSENEGRKDGEEKETLVYEVAGFDPDKWVGVGKGVNAKAESAKSDKK